MAEPALPPRSHGRHLTAEAYRSRVVSSIDKEERERHVFAELAPASLPAQQNAPSPAPHLAAQAPIPEPVPPPETAGAAHVATGPGAASDRTPGAQAASAPQHSVVDEVVASATADQAHGDARQVETGAAPALDDRAEPRLGAVPAEPPETQESPPPDSNPFTLSERAAQDSGAETAPESTGDGADLHDALTREIADAQNTLSRFTANGSGAQATQGDSDRPGFTLKKEPAASDRDAPILQAVSPYLPGWLRNMSPPEAFAWLSGIGLVIAGFAGIRKARHSIDD